jgi:hypothetical protein
MKRNVWDLVLAGNMNNIVKKSLNFVGLFWSYILLLAAASAIEGVVLSYLWEWFVVPLGLKPVSILHAIGLCVLLDFVTYHYYDYKKSEEVGLVTALTYILIRPIIAIIVGAALHYSM